MTAIGKKKEQRKNKTVSVILLENASSKCSNLFSISPKTKSNLAIVGILHEPKAAPGTLVPLHPRPLVSPARRHPVTLVPPGVARGGGASVRGEAAQGVPGAVWGCYKPK